MFIEEEASFGGTGGRVIMLTSSTETDGEESYRAGKKEVKGGQWTWEVTREGQLRPNRGGDASAHSEWEEGNHRERPDASGQEGSRER